MDERANERASRHAQRSDTRQRQKAAFPAVGQGGSGNTGSRSRGSRENSSSPRLACQERREGAPGPTSQAYPDHPSNPRCPRPLETYSRYNTCAGQEDAGREARVSLGRRSGMGLGACALRMQPETAKARSPTRQDLPAKPFFDADQAG